MKNIQHLIADTDRIRQIFEQWSENQNIPAIERDIVLDKLRHLYEILLSETVIDFADPAPSQNVCPAPSVTEQEKTEQTAEPAAAAPTPSGLTTEGPVAVSHESTSAPAPHTVSETILGSVSHEEHKEPSEPDTEMEPRLFEEDQMPRPKVDKQVILSLYGDDPTPAKPVSFNRPADPVQPHFRQPAAPIPTAPQMRPTEPAPAAETAPTHTPTEMGSTPSKKVFGEVLSENSSIPMNEALGKQNNHTDVATKLQAKSINGDLRQHIGINDRFMIIRNLFGGNAEAFNATMAQLNTFTNLDDALLYIQDHYSWNPDDESVKMIIDLLERKLG